MKILFRVILLILFVNCQNNQLTKNVSEKKTTTYQKDFAKRAYQKNKKDRNQI